MKSILMILACAAIACAQSTTNCTVTSTLPATSTITDLTVSTYCPVCDAAKSTGGVYTTVFETSLVAVCPTGLSTAVYTVTETCTGTTPINTSTPPAGFTTTAVVCTACPGSSTVVVTTPVAAAATGGGSGAAGSATTSSTVAQYTGAASFVSFNGLTAVAAGMGSVFATMLLM